MDIKTVLLAVLAGVLVVGLASYLYLTGSVGLAVEFTGMDALAGRPLAVRVVDERTLAEAARQAIESIRGPAFKVQFANLKKGESYRIDFYADMNQNGVYDPPPIDQAWRVSGILLQKDTTVSFTPTPDTTDIAWPQGMPVANPGTNPAIGPAGPADSSTVTVDGTIASGEYRHSLEDPMTGIWIYWQNDSQKLYVGLVSPGTGWVAVGFDPETGMQGANIIIAAVVGTRLVIEDQFGTSPISHSPDGSQDVLVSAGKESGGKTTVEFAIPLDSGDPADTALSPGTTHKVLLSYQNSDDSFNVRHTKRTVTSLTLDP